MTVKTALALAALLLPLLFGAMACDSNSNPVAGCLPSGGASTDSLSGLAVSSTADACAQGLADAVERSTGTLTGAADGGASPGSGGQTGQTGPLSTAPRRGQR